MNDPEVTMSPAATNTNLVALSKALEAAGIAIKLVMRAPDQSNVTLTTVR